MLNMPRYWYPLLFLAAFTAGFVDSIAGGGGLITVPLLLSAGLPPLDALGTNKLQASFGSGSATWQLGEQCGIAAGFPGRRKDALRDRPADGSGTMDGRAPWLPAGHPQRGAIHPSDLRNRGAGDYGEAAVMNPNRADLRSSKP